MSRVTEISDEEEALREEPERTTGGGNEDGRPPSEQKTKLFIYGGAAAGAVLGVLILIASTGVSAATSSQSSLLYLLLAAVVGAGTGALVGLGIARRHQIGDFYHGVKQEMAKVTWPTRNDVWSTTVVVLIAVLFFGFYLWGVDRIVTVGFEALERAIR